MKTTFRAIVAVSLLAGFYLLVAVIVGAAIALDVVLLIRGDGQGLQAALAVTLAAAALVRALILVSRRRPGNEPGIAVSHDDEPALWQTVDDLATTVNTRPPDEIRLVPEVNAAVSEETKFLGLKAIRRRMYIGIPLLTSMTVDEMRAVLGHELGHYSGSHTRLGAPVYRGRIALTATVQGLDSHPFVRRIFLGYAKLFFRISQAVSRRQELEADELAVAISGRSAAAGALRKVHGLAAAWDLFMNSYAGLIGPAQARPADLFEGFTALVGDPVRQREMAAAIAEIHETSPYDSHPSLPDRLSAIERLPDSDATPDQRPATVLLRDAAAASRAVQDAMLTEQALALPAVSWEDLVAQGMYAATNREALRDLAVAGQRVVGAAEPSLDAGLEALAQGFAPQLRTELVNAGWNDGERLLDYVIARALEGALIEHGSAQWTLSWSSHPRLLDSAGQEIKLDEFAAAIVADPGAQVPAARQWLVQCGIDEHHQPGLTSRGHASVWEP